MIGIEDSDSDYGDYGDYSMSSSEIEAENDIATIFAGSLHEIPNSNTLFGSRSIFGSNSFITAENRQLDIASRVNNGDAIFTGMNASDVFNDSYSSVYKIILRQLRTCNQENLFHEFKMIRDERKKDSEVAHQLIERYKSTIGDAVTFLGYIGEVDSNVFEDNLCLWNLMIYKEMRAFDNNQNRKTIKRLDKAMEFVPDIDTLKCMVKYSNHLSSMKDLLFLKLVADLQEMYLKMVESPF